MHYEMAADTAKKGRSDQAKATIKALRLDWVGYDMENDKATSVSLIAAELS